MLAIEILQRTVDTTSPGFVASKKIMIGEGFEAFFQIACPEANLGTFIEKTIIDLILSNIQNRQSLYSDFSYILERMNKSLRELQGQYDLSALRIFLGITMDDELHFSVRGKYCVCLVNRDEPSDIAAGMEGDSGDFSYISSGSIRITNTLFVANIPLLECLTDEDLAELGRIAYTPERSRIIETLLAHELPDRHFTVVTVTHPAPAVPDPTTVRKNIVLSYVQGHWETVSGYARRISWIESIRLWVASFPPRRKHAIRMGFFGLGVVVSVVLLYFIISAIFVQRVSTALPQEYKNKLIEAELIIEKANKNISNRDAFDTDIKNAEDLIFAVRDKQLFLNDVKKELDEIAVLKRQMDGIESFKIVPENTTYSFKTPRQVVGIFEDTKKLYFVGQNEVMGPFIPGDTDVKVSTYPDGEEAVSADMDSGIIYILTKSNRVLRYSKGQFTYATVTGQQTWEDSLATHVYNGNVYLLSKDGHQIFKHKPGVNGFSAKSGIISDSDAKSATGILLDFAVDGGFYLLNKDLAIDRMATAPSYSRRSVVIDNLPKDEYSVDDGTANPRLVLGGNSYYLYMLLNNRIWVFEPNSKNAKDVNAVRYIGQIDTSEGIINSIYVPTDGTVYAAMKSGIYKITFDVVDGKIVVK